jgi:hypothetical protein
MLRVPLMVRNGLGVICGPKHLNDAVPVFLSAILHTWNFVKFDIDNFNKSTNIMCVYMCVCVFILYDELGMYF